MFHKIARFAVLGGFLCLLAAAPLTLAQTGDLWKDGAWSVASPAGNCGGIPLLEAKGPGSLFDAKNAAPLADLEKSLPAAVGRVCPGVREVIVVSGRTRRLIRLNNPAPATPAATPVSAAPPEQVPLAAPPPARP